MDEENDASGEGQERAGRRPRSAGSVAKRRDVQTTRPRTAASRRLRRQEGTVVWPRFGGPLHTPTPAPTTPAPTSPRRSRSSWLPLLLLLGVCLSATLGHLQRRWEAQAIVARTALGCSPADLPQLAIHLEAALRDAGLRASSWDVLLQWGLDGSGGVDRGRVVVLMQDRILLLPMPYRIEQRISLPAEGRPAPGLLQEGGWRIRETSDEADRAAESEVPHRGAI